MWYVCTVEYNPAIKKNEIMSYIKMDGTGRHIKCNKAKTARQIL